jgi:hypothetical protein
MIGSLPSAIISGATNYEIGFSIGQTFGERIRNFVAQYQTLHSILIPFYNSSDGKKIFTNLLQINQKKFPQYFDEIHGVAQGAKVPEYQLQLLNFEPEITTISKGILPQETSCSDLHLRTNQQVLLAHNEDSDSSIKDYAYYINVQPTNRSLIAFQAYTYPGYLPGNAFGFNEHGLIFTCNALFPASLNVQTGYARYFINRSVVDSVSIEDALARVTVQPGANGFSLNLGSTKEKVLLNVEVSPYYSFSVTLTEGNASHVNDYKHLNVPCLADLSSVHRQQRIDMYPAWANASDMLTILGDHSDIEYPIFRNGNPPDTNVSTVATGLFDLTHKYLQVYQDNPQTSKPVFTAQLY